MTNRSRSEEHILCSWAENASPWAEAIDRGAIASRRLVTDGAIVAALLAGQPRSVLDIGCGEGWLGRALAARGVQVAGIDATTALIEAARRQAGPLEHYHQLAYADLAAAELRPRPQKDQSELGAHPGRAERDGQQQFDALACNFSLLGRESVEQVFAGAARLLRPGGRLVVQTLHPLEACGQAPYRDGWRQGSWEGFGAGFSNPPPLVFPHGRQLAGPVPAQWLPTGKAP